MAENRTFTRQELFDLVWSKPIQQLARDFKLSNVGLAKRCKRRYIPLPPRGYWQKVAVGKRTTRPALPTSPDGVDRITFKIPDDIPPTPDPVITPEVAAWIAREHDPRNTIRVPRSISMYDPLVRKARLSLEKRGVLGVDDGWRSAGRDTFNVHVTKPLVGRSCRVLNALIAALKQRNFLILMDTGEPAVNVMGERFKLALSETSKRAAHTPTADDIRREERGLRSPRKYDYVPTGRLCLRIESGFETIAFEDNEHRQLEEHLNEAILGMVRKVLEVLRPARVKREAEERKRLEAERERWLFQEKCNGFEAAYHAWTEQQNRLQFVATLEEKVRKLENRSDSLLEYVVWARRYVESADPLSRLFDALTAGTVAHYHEFTVRRVY